MNQTTLQLRPGGLRARLAAPSQERPFIVVTGPGRSGTSAVARVLHESGIPMGETFGPSSEYNPVGFYEELPVCELNDRIMLESGMERLDRWPWRSTVLAVGAKYGEQMRELVAGASAGGWKDPRFCVTLEAWLPYLPGPPKVVVCLRSPEAFIHSVMRIFGLIPRDVIEGWWANHLRRLLAVIRDYGLDATCVEYEELVQRPEETVAALSEFAGQPLDARYVEPELRHYDQPVPRRYASLYEEVRALGPRRTARPLYEQAMPVDAYVERAREIEARVAAAKEEWHARVGTLRPALPAEDAGLAQAGPLRETRAASAAYEVVLSEAQDGLRTMTPPPALERYHELTREFVDQERLVAHLLWLTTDGSPHEERFRNDALRAWDLFAAPDAASKARERRRREYEKALRASGLVASQAR